MKIDFAKYHRFLAAANPVRMNGTVSEIIGLVVAGNGPLSSIGDICSIYPTGSRDPLAAEVVGFKNGQVLMMPLESIQGLGPGCKIQAIGKKASVKVGRGMLGRVIDGLGKPLDNLGPIPFEETYPLYAEPINPLARQRISEPIDLGIRAINGLLSCGRGQRMGIFSGSGVGKSVLLGMIARNSEADVNVIGLIGERGREVREFLEKNLGPEGMKRSVVVVAASDKHPLIRMRAAYVATAVSEYFRDQGKNVLLMVDSLTRFAMAQREIGLSVGEPPTTKGYTPSVFSVLPRLLERAGSLEGKGSVTGLYSVLVEGDDFNEPVSDAARSILDGHITLSRELANKNHYPSIDILQSNSRVMIDIVDEEHKNRANELVNILATYQKAEDMINIGAYVAGSSQEIDRAIALIDPVNSYLRQDIGEKIGFRQARSKLIDILQVDRL
ncbi:MAG: flagellar protein export ATPase FliI [Smithellaceae bacterium]|nr:flagellar protein export ATPase FliI [Smithellaceae bacterium]